MRASLLPVAILSLCTAACGDLVATDDVDTAVVTLSTYTTGAGGYVLSPIAIVYADRNVSFTPPVTGQCNTTPFDPNVTGSVIGGRTMNAGPFMLADLPARQDTLYGAVEFGIRLYRLGFSGGMSVIPGDTLTLSILPGTAFPETVFAIRTAEEFVFDAIPVPDVNEDIQVSWRGAAEPGTQMHFSLRYVSETSPGGLNEQVFCVFADNGSGTIPAGVAQGWVNSVGGQRQVVATRIRSREVQVDGKHRVSMVSTFQMPTPQLAP